MFEVLINKVQKYNTFITGCAKMTNFEDGTFKNTFSDQNDTILDGETCILDVLYQTHHAWGAMHGKIYRKELFNNIRFPNINHLEDYMVSLPLYNEIDDIYFCSKPMYHYCSVENSLSKRGFDDETIKIIDTAQQIKEYFICHGANKKILGGVDNFLWRMYCDVFWKIYKSNIPYGKEIIKERRKAGLKAFCSYIRNSQKCISDLKNIIKFFLSIIWAYGKIGKN